MQGFGSAGLFLVILWALALAAIIVAGAGYISKRLLKRLREQLRIGDWL